MFDMKIQLKARVDYQSLEGFALKHPIKFEKSFAILFYRI